MNEENKRDDQRTGTSGLENENENEGEGNKTAARRYNDATQKYVESGKVEPAAREAQEAIEGPEGDDLRRAEKEGKSHARPPTKGE